MLSYDSDYIEALLLNGFSKNLRRDEEDDSLHSYIGVHVCVYIYIHIYIYIYTYTYIQICIYKCIYISIYLRLCFNFSRKKWTFSSGSLLFQRFRRRRAGTAWTRRRIEASLLIVIVMLRALTYIAKLLI